MRRKQKGGNRPIKEYLLSALIVALVIAIPFAIVKTQDSNRNSQAASVQPVGQTGGWNMIFSDEFNGTSLNTAVWTPGWFGTGITGPVNSAEIACYDSALATVPGDGNLHLKLIQQQNTCKGSTRPYTGALVSSNGKFQYSYGYVEFRAFLPAASAGVVANWPATWSDGQNWPTDGENDTMEGLGGKACYHFHSPVGGPGGCANGDYTGWHTFGSDWQPGKVIYYYDGVKVGEITSGITSSPQYLIMNNSTDSDNPLLLPADMLVDYVRVWQKCTTNCEPTPTTVVATNTPVPTNNPLPTATPTPVVSSDITPPSVTVTSPTNGSTVRRGSKVTVTASASDNVGVNRVQFYVGSSLLCTDTTAPYSCNWNVPSKKNVTYVLRATAFDTTGNSSSSSVSVTAK